MHLEPFSDFDDSYGTQVDPVSIMMDCKVLIRNIPMPKGTQKEK